jgi:surface carbohydrate biosynthesis protein (TIGR04326 family)
MIEGPQTSPWPGPVVFITSEPLDLIPPEVYQEYAHTSVVAVGLNGGEADGVVPAGWVTVKPGELLDAVDLREQFFASLEAWPDNAVSGDRSFNDLVTVDGKYSIWWTSVAADRQFTRGIFKYFRYALLVDRAIERCAPTTILLFTRDPLCATLVQSRSDQSGIVVRPLPGSAERSPRDVAVNGTWLARSLWHTLSSPLQHMVRALKYRWTVRTADLFRRSAGATVVFTSTWPRHLRLRSGQVSLAYWDEISKALETVEPSVAHAYLPRKLEDIVDEETSVSGVDAITRVRAPLLIWECSIPLRGVVSRIARQMLAICRFHRLAQRREFRESFRFAKADMAAVLVPDLKEAVARGIDWSFKSAQVASALRAAGPVKAVVVSAEMYAYSMPTMAAAASLGIPTIGVQHGTIMPTHLMYALPRGHVEHAPVPDYFGAYGDYGKEVVSLHGAYPANRVWITGAARLDPLVNRSPDQTTARAALGLPVDKPIVVLATQTFPWFVSAQRAVLECMRDYPDAVLCVKRNPSVHAMPLAEIDAIAAELGVRNMRGFDKHTELLLAACSVWISASSTTILEATLLGRPTICLNFSGQPDRYPYVEDGVSLPARSADELKRSVAQVLSPSGAHICEDRRQAFLRRHVGPTTDGLGALTFARRVADLIAD